MMTPHKRPQLNPLMMMMMMMVMMMTTPHNPPHLSSLPWATRPVVNIRQFCFIAPILPLILYCSRAKSLLQQHAHNDIVHQAKCENKDRAKLQSVQRILIKRICLSRKNRTPTPALAKNKDQEEVELKKPK